MTKKPEAECGAAELLQQALVPAAEQLYPVPANWLWVRLIGGYSECLDSFRKPVNSTERAAREGDIPYYGATGQVGWIDDYLTNENLVLVGEDGAPFFDYLRDKAYLIEGRAWVNNHAHILKSYYGYAGNKYLMHYLNCFDYRGYVNGTTRLKLTQGSLAQIPIPFPPLSEQQRIVSVIEALFAKLDRARELLEEVQSEFEEQKATILARAFRGELTAKWREERGLDNFSTEEILPGNVQSGKKDSADLSEETTDIYFDIPNDWNWMRLRDCCEKFQYGTSEKSDTVGEMPVLRMGNLQNGSLVWDDLAYTSNEMEMEKYRLNHNDILFNRTNSPELVGKTAIYKSEMEAIFAGYLIRVRANSNMMPDYINCYLNSIYAKKKCQIVKTDGVSQSNINAAKLGGFEIPVPSFQEQREIVRIMDELLDKTAVAATLCDQMEQIDQLKKTILAKAFRGELDTNDLAEESAEKLLREVLQQRAAEQGGSGRKKRRPLEADHMTP